MDQNRANRDRVGQPRNNKNRRQESSQRLCRQSQFSRRYPTESVPVSLESRVEFPELGQRPLVKQQQQPADNSESTATTNRQHPKSSRFVGRRTLLVQSAASTSSRITDRHLVARRLDNITKGCYYENCHETCEGHQSTGDLPAYPSQCQETPSSTRVYDHKKNSRFPRNSNGYASGHRNRSPRRTENSSQGEYKPRAYSPPGGGTRSRFSAIQNTPPSLHLVRKPSNVQCRRDSPCTHSSAKHIEQASRCATSEREIGTDRYAPNSNYSARSFASSRRYPPKFRRRSQSLQHENSPESSTIGDQLEPPIPPESSTADSFIPPESSAADLPIPPESSTADPSISPESSNADLSISPESSTADPSIPPESSTADPSISPESSTADLPISPESSTAVLPISPESPTANTPLEPPSSSKRSTVSPSPEVTSPDTNDCQTPPMLSHCTPVQQMIKNMVAKENSQDQATDVANNVNVAGRYDDHERWSSEESDRDSIPADDGITVQITSHEAEAVYEHPAVDLVDSTCEDISESFHPDVQVEIGAAAIDEVGLPTSECSEDILQTRETNGQLVHDPDDVGERDQELGTTCDQIQVDDTIESLIDDECISEHKLQQVDDEKINVDSFTTVVDTENGDVNIDRIVSYDERVDEGELVELPDSNNDKTSKKPIQSGLSIPAVSYPRRGNPYPKYNKAPMNGARLPFTVRGPFVPIHCHRGIGGVSVRPTKPSRGHRNVYLTGQQSRRNPAAAVPWCRPGYPVIASGYPQQTWCYPHHRPMHPMNPRFLVPANGYNALPAFPHYLSTFANPLKCDALRTASTNETHSPTTPNQTPPPLDANPSVYTATNGVISSTYKHTYVDSGVNTDFEDATSGRVVYSRVYNNIIMAAVSNEDGGDGLYKQIDPYCLTDQFHIERGFVEIYEADGRISRGVNTYIRGVFMHPALPSTPYLKTDTILPYTSPFNLVARAIYRPYEHRPANQSIGVIVGDPMPSHAQTTSVGVGTDTVDDEEDDCGGGGSDRAQSVLTASEVGARDTTEGNIDSRSPSVYDVFRSNMTLMVKAQAAAEAMKRKTIDNMAISDVRTNMQCILDYHKIRMNSKGDAVNDKSTTEILPPETLQVEKNEKENDEITIEKTSDILPNKDNNSKYQKGKSDFDNSNAKKSNKKNRKGWKNKHAKNNDITCSDINKNCVNEVKKE